MTKKMVTYRGIQVVEGWPEKIEKAQLVTTCFPNGKEMQRVRYGSEEDNWGAGDRPCHDCAVVKGELHVPGCDVERCPSCGGQIFGCECSWQGYGSSKAANKAPKPFSTRELRIVAARRKFRWRHIGFAPDGDALFEVANESEVRLPFLSIGVQGRGGTKLIGGAWLDVSTIEPGCSAVTKRDCYKDKLLQDEVECFSKEDPTPETRDRYWEFKKLPKRTAPDAIRTEGYG